MPKFTSQREKILEAMLFASGESVPVSRLAAALDCDVPLVRNILEKMAQSYAKEDAGIQLREADDCFRLCTNPNYFPDIVRLLNIRPRRALSQSLLETLSVIAFKQPVTKSVIENIRGVNSDHGVNRLVEYGLVEEKGRVEAPGRPMLFGTTEQFLLYYGLKNVEELLAAASAGELPPTEFSPDPTFDSEAPDDFHAEPSFDSEISDDFHAAPSFDSGLEFSHVPDDDFHADPSCDFELATELTGDSSGFPPPENDFS